MQSWFARRSCALLAHVAGALALREGGAVAGAGAWLKPATNSRACVQEGQAALAARCLGGEAEPNNGGA